MTGTEDKYARWERLGKQGIEDTLLESGFPEAYIKDIKNLYTTAGSITQGDLRKFPNRRLGTDDGTSLLLAMLGRNGSPLENLELKATSYPLNEDEVEALCWNLSSNVNIKVLSLENQIVFGTLHGCRLLGKALKTNSALKELKLSSLRMSTEAVKSLMDGLEGNTAIQVLNISRTALPEEAFKYVAQMLGCNASLKSLDLFQTGCTFNGAHVIAQALVKNKTLESLFVGGNSIREEGLKTLLAILNPTPDGLQDNSTLRAVAFNHMEREDFCVEPLASMIKTNKTLHSLNIGAVSVSSEDWVDQIIPALQQNDTLKDLNLSGQSQLSQGVFDALKNLVRFTNTALEVININDTPVAMSAGILNEELRINKEYRSNLRNQKEVPSTTGRLVLCGYEYAGKTSICKTMKKIEDRTSSPDPWSKRLPTFLQHFLFGSRSRRELRDRTRGFNIVLLDNLGGMRTLLWDFAGQKEYYALHDYLFPNVKNSCFVYVCNPLHSPYHQTPHQTRSGDMFKTRDEMKSEFVYWLRFIVSNSKLLDDADGQRQLPNVTFVLTNKDKSVLHKDSLLSAMDIVAEAKTTFKGVIDLYSTVEYIDARSIEDVGNLRAIMIGRLEKFLEHSKEYVVCGLVVRAMETWLKSNPGCNPIITFAQFQNICTGANIPGDEFKAAKLNSREGQTTVLAYLNDVGSVIFAKKLEFIVVDPRWFGIGVVGSLVNAFEYVQLRKEWSGLLTLLGCLKSQKEFTLGDCQERGVVRREVFKKVLGDSLEKAHLKHLKEKISPDLLIDLLIHLEMCFEIDPGERSSGLFVPPSFGDDDMKKISMRPLEWKSLRKGALVEPCFIGRRLECDDKTCTMLTPGFFPRLQVALRNHLEKMKWRKQEFFEVDKNLIRFVENGIEVMVEYSGDIDFFVDVLVLSYRSPKETLEFIDTHVVGKILDVCASPQGCQGVVLVQAAIRPECVKKPYPCAVRVDHSIRISELERLRETYGDDYQHYWNISADLPADVPKFDVVLDMLEGKDSSVDTNPLPLQQSRTPWPSSASASEESIAQLLNHFYLTVEDVGSFENFLAGTNLTKLIPFKLHLMCCGKHKAHTIPHQEGITLHVRYSDSGTNVPLMQYGAILILVAAKLGAGTAGLPLSVQWLNDWINKKLSVETIRDSMEMVQEVQGPGTNPMDLLEKYMKADPDMVREFLSGKLNKKNIYEDFGLRYFLYPSSSNVNQVYGWLCKDHYVSHRKQYLNQ